MQQYSREYLERRERMERAAAKSATCPQARRVHQELAQEYAVRLQQLDVVQAALVDVPAVRRRLSIITGVRTGA